MEGAVLSSVVPTVTRLAHTIVKQIDKIECLELTSKTVIGIGIDYPKPETIGPDRLANAVAVHHHFGAPVVAVDFGTAATFEIVDKAHAAGATVLIDGAQAAPHLKLDMRSLGADFYVDETAVRRAIQRRSTVNLIHQPSAIKVDLFMAGHFPLDRLVTRYDFADINQAAADAISGATIKPILRLPA